MKRDDTDYEALSREIEAGNYTAAGPVEVGPAFWDDLRHKKALMHNALEYLAEARSTVLDHLTNLNDLHARIEILQDLDMVEHNIRQAL